MKKFTLIFALLIFSMALLMSQAVSEYTYSTSTTGSLEDMSTGTTALLAAGSYYDDAASPVTNIGFTFTFGGAGYTQFSANSNGHMRLGATAIATFPSFAANTAYFYPLSGDNAILATGKLHYKVVGAAPNRKLVVEWTGFRIPYGSTGTGSTMQVWLTETSNRVDYVYGAMYASGATSRGVTIATSNVAGSIGNVSTINTTPTYITTGTTVVNTSFVLGDMVNLNSTADGSRRVFSWVPPVAGTAPNPAIIAAPADGAINVSKFPTLSWSGGGGLPDGYKIYFGTTLPGTPNATQASTTWATGELAYSTTYQWKIVPYNAFGDAPGCPTWSFTTMDDPTISTLPYTQDFETWPPLGWDLTGGTYSFAQYLSGANNWARANFWSQSAGNTDIMTTPPINPSEPARIKFTWSHQYNSTYPNDALTVRMSANLTDWTDVWYKTGTDFNSNDGAGSTTPGTGVVETLAIPAQFVGAPFYLRFFGYSGYGPDLFIDNVIVEEIPEAPIVSYAPQTIDFGTVSQNVLTGPQNVTITNVGGGTLNVTTADLGFTGTNPGMFSYDDANLPAALGAAESVTIPVYFTATAEGALSANFVFSYDGTDYEVALSGNALSNNPEFSYTPNSLNFGSVAQGTPAGPQNVTVTNLAGGVLNLGNADIAIIGTNADQFSYDDVNLPAALGFNQSVVIPVYYTATFEGAATATLRITYDSVDYDVALSGSGLPEGLIIIGNGTVAMNANPINPYYGYTYSQQIYLQSEINVADSRIETVSFYWNGLAEATLSNNWVIYMGHTPNTSFATTTSWIPLANLTQVFAGEVALPATAGWIEIPLTVPFTYNNTDNLVIAVDENEASYDDSIEKFLGTSDAAARSINYYSDTTNPDPAVPPTGSLIYGYPNVMFAVGDAPEDPIFGYAPTSINFYNGVVGTPGAYQNVVVTNTGGGTLNLAGADIALEGANADQFEFSTANLPAALGATQNVSIPVRFAPDAVGAQIATLVISYGGSDYEVELTGISYPADGLVQDFEGMEFPPAYWSMTGTGWLQTISGQHNVGLLIQGNKAAASGQFLGDAESMLVTQPFILDGNSSTVGYWTRGMNNLTGYGSSVLQLKYALNGTEDWTNLGDPIDYLDNNGVRYVTVDLSALPNGTYKLGFATTSSFNLDGYLSWVVIDGVNGPEAYFPAGTPGHVTLTSPADGAIDLNPNSVDLAWTQDFEQGAPEYYQVYVASDPETIFDEFYFETTASPFDLSAQQDIDFQLGYLTTWYWAVLPANESGSPDVEDPEFMVWSFTTGTDGSISSFPYTQDFEGTFPPNAWTIIDDATVAPYTWAQTAAQNHTTGGGFSAYHRYNGSYTEDGWLISPVVNVPADRALYQVSFWNYNGFPTYYVYNGVLVSTGSPDPVDGDFVEIWTPDAVTAAWSQETLSLGDYAGQSIYIAFRYGGLDAHDWYLDDIVIEEEPQVDMTAPTITHSWLINTINTTDDYLVYADITDDAVWMSGIGVAEMSYSINGGVPVVVPMTLDRDGYYAYIPAQPLDTEVVYSIYAEDASAQANGASTPEYTFFVEEPTWMYYDTGTPTTFLGSATVAWGAGVLYPNPLGAGNPLQINIVETAAYNVGAGNLNIYTFDGTDLVSVYTAPVSFATAQAWTQFTVPAVTIDSPYYMVSFEGMNFPNYIALDGASPYTDMCYYFANDQIYTLANAGGSGAWMIYVEVETGTIQGLDAPVVSIASSIDGPALSWDAVAGANSYNIYGSADPYAAQPWNLLGNVGATEWVYSGIENMSFFQVTASSDAPLRMQAANAIRLQSATLGTPAKATQSPKGAFQKK